MRHKWQDFPKLAAVIGGFLVMVGILLLGIEALALSGFLNVGILLEGKYLLPFAVLMVVVGLLDTLSAMIIARW